MERLKSLEAKLAPAKPARMRLLQKLALFLWSLNTRKFTPARDMCLGEIHCILQLSAVELDRRLTPMSEAA